MDPVSITLIAISSLLLGIPTLLCIATFRAYTEETVIYDWTFRDPIIVSNPVT